MRVLFIGLAAILCVCLTNPAQAERRTFVIASDGDGYGIDRCLAAGAPCGRAVANAYCKRQDFAEAASYSKVDRDDITGAIPASTSGSCSGKSCNGLVAIVRTR